MPPPEHPDNVFVPLGECQGCHKRQFLDGTPDDLRVRPHYEQREHVRQRYEVEAQKQGKRYVNYPNCNGSGKVPVANSVSFPLFSYPRTDAR